MANKGQADMNKEMPAMANEGQAIAAKSLEARLCQMRDRLATESPEQRGQATAN